MITRIQNMETNYMSDDEEIVLQPNTIVYEKKTTPNQDLDLESVIAFFIFFIITRYMGYVV
tara:strand:+ start:454 stop:636 length:183 start_codon:yes stop_codon:yes gene_type:complete